MVSLYSKIIHYFHHRIFYIWLLIFSFLSTLISPENSPPYAIVSTFILYYLIYSIGDKVFNLVIWFITITLSLYYPVYQYYGALNSGIIAALFETNITESFDFIRKLSLDDFIFPFVFILSALILIRLKKYNVRPIIDKRQKILHIMLWVVFIFTLTFIPTKFYLKGKNMEDEQPSWTLANSPINVISFYANIYDSIHSYFIEKHQLADMLNQPNPWHIESVSPKYQNYVLIIGESARRDYFSVFGFSQPTTPFLDSANGYFNSGYISAAPATYHSLLKTLYFKNGKDLNYAYNIISLAKAAHIGTNWLSNQGSIGHYDMIASRIGISADYSYFTKKGGFNTKSVDDMALLKDFALRLNTPIKSGSKSRLFVLHLMGSHQNFCHRISKNEHKLTYINKNMSCYANSILKTDTFIQKTIHLLKERHQSYSLIYFSDHGLNYTNNENKDRLTLDYSQDYQSNYNVPFIKLSSDDTKHTVVNIPRSAFNFIYGYANWLGIKSKELDNNYQFFSNRPDEHIKVFNFTKKVDYSSLKKENIPDWLKLIQEKSL